jgi:hypothetical protein
LSSFNENNHDEQYDIGVKCENIHNEQIENLVEEEIYSDFMEFDENSYTCSDKETDDFICAGSLSFHKFVV